MASGTPEKKSQLIASTAETSNLEEVKQEEKEEISPENDSKAGAPLTKEEKERNRKKLQKERKKEREAALKNQEGSADKKHSDI